MPTLIRARPRSWSEKLPVDPELSSLAILSIGICLLAIGLSLRFPEVAAALSLLG